MNRPYDRRSTVEDSLPSTRQTLCVELPKGSIMLPAWILFIFCGAFILSSVGLLLTWETNRSLRGEVRVLQINLEDIENVLIRQSLASRADFVLHAGDTQGGVKK